MKLALVLLGLMITTPAMAAEQRQFDLQCGKGRDAIRYRVDLDRGEWCSEKCLRTFKIASVTAGELVLEDKPEQTPKGPSSSVRISRVTGEWSAFYATGPGVLPSSYRGICEAATFSGFPAARF